MRAPLVSSAELCSRSGATYRQVDYWARNGILCPEVEASGTGTRRSYGADQVRRARALVALSRLAAVGGRRRTNLLRKVPPGPPPWVIEADGLRIRVEEVK